MKYLLPLAIALVFTACNDAKKAEEANTTAPVEMNATETTTAPAEMNATDATAPAETNATETTTAPAESK